MTISELNLQEYYDYCKSIYNTHPNKAYKFENQINYIENITTADGMHHIHLIVEGIVCGSCVWLIENALKTKEFISSARINLSTRRLIVSWEGEKSMVYEIIKLIEGLSYHALPYDADLLEAEDQTRYHNLLKYLGVAGLAFAQTMMLSIAVWSSLFDTFMSNGTQMLLNTLSAFIAIPCALYASSPFFSTAWAGIKRKQLNMDLPISLAVVASLGISIQELMRNTQDTYFEAPIMLIFFLLIGRILDFKMHYFARSKAQRFIMTSSKAFTLYQNGRYTMTNIKEAKIGDIAFVPPGMKIPLDGVVIEGNTMIDNSLMTGESIPITIKEGMEVIAGMINISHPIKFKITKIAENTVLSKIINLIEGAQQNRDKYIMLADKASKIYTPAILFCTAITFLYWIIIKGSELNDALLNAISVMIITCPCALGLAVPIVQIITTGLLISKGIFIKSSDALERISEIDTISFDKTGTLTIGKPKLINAMEISKRNFRIIASLASNSKHPLCKAILEYYENDEIINIEDVQEIVGSGIEGRIGKDKFKIGNRRFSNIKSSQSHDEYQEVWFCKNHETPQRLVFEDQLKKDAYDIIQELKDNFNVVIISGDREEVVKSVAQKLNITNYHFDCSPKQKSALIDTYKRERKKVMMIGDGINDAIALKSSHVGLSPSSGVDLSQYTSDVVFGSDKIAHIKTILKLSQSSRKITKQNLCLSILYNVLTVPLAMLGFANPIIAAILMSSSSILVLLNSLRLKNDE